MSLTRGRVEVWSETLNGSRGREVKMWLIHQRFKVLVVTGVLVGLIQRGLKGI